MRFNGALAGICFFVGGCATDHPALTRQEFLAVTKHHYDGRTSEQIITAAERVLTLADGSDFKFADNPNGFVATRNWSVYAIFAVVVGTDTWIANVESDGKGAAITLQVGTEAGAMTGMPTGGGSVSPFTMPGVTNPVGGTAIYDLFWSRLDYMLGKRLDWMTCEEADQRVKNGLVWGNNEALCNSFNIKDDKPDSPLFVDSMASK